MTAKVICINNNKGGVLKTTTTTNLAGVLANAGKKVLIVDADNQANVSLAFGKNPDTFRTSLYDVLCGGLAPEDTLVKVHDNIAVLPSNRDMLNFEFDVISNIKKYPEPFYLMTDALEHLREDFDYILIDTPPSLGLMNGNVFTFSDYVIIPYAPETFSMRSLVEVVDTIRGFRDKHNPNLEILGILRTLVDSRTNAHTDVITDTNKYAFENGVHIFDTIITETVQFENAVLYHGMPATLLPPKKRDKAQLYYELANEIERFFERGVEA